MKWFLNRSTQTKLMTAFMTVCAMLVIVGAVGIANLEKMDLQVQSLAEKHMKGVTAILSAESNMYKTGKAMRQSILESTVEEVRAQNDVATAAMSEMETNFAECEKTLVTAEAKARMQKIHELYPRWVDAQRRAMQLALEMKNSEAVAVVQKAAVEANEMAAAAAEIRKSKIDLGDQAARDASVAYQRARALMIAIVVAGALLAVGLGVFISRLLSRPLQQAEQVLAVVAEGDFTRRLAIDTRDEVGRLATSLNKAVESMRGALSQVAHTAQEVSTASGELSSASQSISAGAQEQASSLEETAASLEEMTSAVKQNADNAQQAAQLAQGAREVAEKGGKVVGAAVSAMSEINASSRKIADIITAIDEIAFQTNLLALNAAVEAARAGEQGRGFAVVAGEVRNLAQRSATAAKEIKGLISDSVEKVESGSQLVNQSGATLDEIVQSVKRVTDIVGEIAASSREQSTGIEQVNTAVTQMDAVTQANASQTEELAGTAEGLSQQAQALMTLVQRFRLGDGGAPPAVARAVSNAPARAVAKAKVVPMRAGRRAAAKAAPVVVAPIAAATGTDGFEEF